MLMLTLMVKTIRKGKEKKKKIFFYGFMFYGFVVFSLMIYDLSPGTLTIILSVYKI